MVEVMNEEEKFEASQKRQAGKAYLKLDELGYVWDVNTNRGDWIKKPEGWVEPDEPEKLW